MFSDSFCFLATLAPTQNPANDEGQLYEKTAVPFETAMGKRKDLHPNKQIQNNASTNFQQYTWFWAKWIPQHARAA